MEVGKDILGFHREAAEDTLVSFEYNLLSLKVPALTGGLSWLLKPLVKMFLRWQIVYTVKGVNRIETLAQSFMKEKAYQRINEKVARKMKEGLTHEEKQELFAEYYPIARAALTL